MCRPSGRTGNGRKDGDSTSPSIINGSLFLASWLVRSCGRRRRSRRRRWKQTSFLEDRFSWSLQLPIMKGLFWARSFEGVKYATRSEMCRARCERYVECLEGA